MKTGKRVTPLVGVCRRVNVFPQFQNIIVRITKPHSSMAGDINIHTNIQIYTNMPKLSVTTA